ncbi:trypsin-like serine peptidase [Halobacteriovorax marinus]|uniref:trypsin-like serine peptidase n=1 Tax=Halobacteriovorax marinus TaxID=97084 RepID=UPI003A91D14B
MKFILLIALVLSSYSHASVKAIYGEDDRLEYSEVSLEYKRLGDATGAMIAKSKLSLQGISYYFSTKTLGEELMGNQFRNGYLCSDEAFHSQQTLSTCSGFLVSSNRLLTAGHCITGKKACSNYLWSFGLSESKMREGKIHRDSVYSCKRVIKRSSGKRDYALIELDRSVVGVTPLRISKKSLKKGEKLFTIGHPSNLPLKFAMNGRVEEISGESFKTSLDTFAGNSGSPVLLTKSREVVGILVRGSLDYVKDLSRGCFVANRCERVRSNADCMGESVFNLEYLK